jgi:hypothetical protein
LQDVASRWFADPRSSAITYIEFVGCATIRNDRDQKLTPIQLKYFWETPHLMRQNRCRRTTAGESPTNQIAAQSLNSVPSIRVLPGWRSAGYFDFSLCF